MTAILSGMKSDVRINLPARVGSARNFQKVSDTSIRMMVEGRKILEAFDELLMNDEWALRQLEAHGSLSETKIDDIAAEKILGERGPVRAVTTGERKPLFDYDAEVTRARKEHEALVSGLSEQQ
jgi:hypothetical protein